ncbi:MAG: hypothetical protein IPM06_21830 [Rhizobiales bacterium]|nr:hypothetical protein [Hyphomicrobiales bacterium]
MPLGNLSACDGDESSVETMPERQQRRFHFLCVAVAQQALSDAERRRYFAAQGVGETELDEAIVPHEIVCD